MQIGGKQISNSNFNKNNLNRISTTTNILKNLNFNQQQFDVSYDAGGVYISSRNEVAYEPFTFECTQSGDTVTVKKGWITLGADTFYIDEGEVTLSGSPTVYVYIEIARGSTSGIFLASTVYPECTYEKIRICLSEYAVSGDNYIFVRTHHKGDKVLDLPIT